VGTVPGAGGVARGGAGGPAGCWLACNPPEEGGRSALSRQDRDQLAAWLGGGGRQIEHQEEGHGSRSNALQRVGAGQDLDQHADVGGWVLMVAGASPDRRPQASTSTKATGSARPSHPAATVAAGGRWLGGTMRCWLSCWVQVGSGASRCSCDGGGGGTGFTFAHRFRDHSPGFAPEGQVLH
jgi:hypothetical protein